MRWTTNNGIATVLLVAGLLIHTIYAITTKHSVLILSTVGDPGAAAAIRALTGYGIPYDTINLPLANPAATLVLEDSPGVGRYSLIVMTSDTLWYQDQNGTSAAAVTPEISAKLVAYLSTYSVRRVTFNAWPNPAFFASPANLENSGCCISGDQPVFFDQSAPTAAAGINPTVQLSTAGLYHYPAVITNLSMAKPFLYFKGGQQDGFPTDTVAGAIVTYADIPREELVLFMAMGDWSVTSLILSHVWIFWGTRGLFLGSRRIYLNTQVDDVFLGTELVSLPGRPNVTYRSTVDDMKYIYSWSKDITQRMPSGSNYVVEMAFNGNGIMIAAEEVNTAFQSLDIDTEDKVGINFIMPLGKGEDRWPGPDIPTDLALGIDPSVVKLDTLFNYFTENNGARLADFTWVSHTFTHENFNNVSFRDVDLELRTNYKVANMIGLPGKAFWSPNSLVSPQISGVFNGDALRALTEFGISTLVGDTSRTNLISPLGLWYPFTTTLNSSNYEGYIIIPRSPTEIYYHCTTPEENTFVYNGLYTSKLGISTFQQVLDRESSRVLYKLLSLNTDSYMFHQANLAMSSSNVTIGTGTGPFGLMQQWVESVLATYLKHVTWPLISLKQDDLSVVFRNRFARDYTCGLTSAYLYDATNTSITGIQVNSTGKCSAPVIVPGDVVQNIVGAVYDKKGNDPLTVWLPMTANSSFTVQLVQSISVVVSSSILVPTSPVV